MDRDLSLLLLFAFLVSLATFMFVLFVSSGIVSQVFYLFMGFMCIGLAYVVFKEYLEGSKDEIE